MNPIVVNQAPGPGRAYLLTLMQKLHTEVGISIDSTRSVISSCIQPGIDYLGCPGVDGYLATFDNSINARAGGLLFLSAGEDVTLQNQSVRRLSWPGVSAYRKTGG